jgi:hypothetical protein
VGECRLTWAPHYRPEWDTAPEPYVAQGVVGWGRSRRLAKAEDPGLGFTAYIGVRHFDPAQWDLPGAPTTTFFASLFLQKRTVMLRTYPTLPQALAAVRDFHERLPL